MTSEIQPRRIEEASINAWPALRQMLLDGWLLRFSGGFTKRANCILPIYASEQPPEEKVRYCENLYARERLQTVFRLTSIGAAEDLDDFLDQRGYRHDDPTEVLYAPSLPDASAPNASSRGSPQRGGTSSDGPRIRLCSRERWLDIYAELTHLPHAAQPLHRAILKGVQTECAYASLDIDGVPRACGLGVIEQDLLGLFDVFTHPQHRGRGLALALVSQLMAWGATQGASTTYLQVAAANEAAKALYKRLGFQLSHHYWYRISG